MSERLLASASYSLPVQTTPFGCKDSDKFAVAQMSWQFSAAPAEKDITIRFCPFLLFFLPQNGPPPQ